MSYNALWKYCTPAHCREFLLSLALVDNESWDDEKKLSCLYAVSRHAHRHYRFIEITKADGSPRRLKAPDPLLKSIQRNILRHVLVERACSSYATAYHPGASTLENAKPHIGKSQILKLDIADFFPSINFEMIMRSAFPGCHFPLPVATMLTHLCCYADSLPQGAPTSPAIANLVMKPFDDHISAWCHERGIAYTRYCDDMTFSGSFDAKAVENKVRAFLQCMGFSLNSRKTRHFRQHVQQQVTGIVVNEKPQTTLAYRRSLRQAVYYCQRYGVAAHLAHIGDTRYLPKGADGVTAYLLSLLGKVGYVLQIRPDDRAFQSARNTLMRLLKEHSGGIRDKTESGGGVL